jgi:hepatocellular carcinoma-associated antigen 59
MQGKLMEVDLGEEARARTIALTEKAKRRLAGEPLDDGDATASDGARPGKRVRLGPDGKPWRGKKRRGSDDLKRDQIVEAFMHENKRTFLISPSP